MSAFLQPGILALLLIAQLGSMSYEKRERASKALHELAPHIIPYLEAALTSRQPEVARRSHLVLASYYERAADKFLQQARPSRWPRLPWLDMLPKDYPDRSTIVEYYIAQARDKIGRKGPPDWEDYRLATELYLHQLFLNQHSLEQAVELLDRMSAQEAKWITENGKNYSPVVKMPSLGER